MCGKELGIVYDWAGEGRGGERCQGPDVTRDPADHAGRAAAPSFLSDEGDDMAVDGESAAHLGSQSVRAARLSWTGRLSARTTSRTARRARGSRPHGRAAPPFPCGAAGGLSGARARGSRRDRPRPGRGTRRGLGSKPSPPLPRRRRHGREDPPGRGRREDAHAFFGCRVQQPREDGGALLGHSFRYPSMRSALRPANVEGKASFHQRPRFREKPWLRRPTRLFAEPERRKFIQDRAELFPGFDRPTFRVLVKRCWRDPDGDAAGARGSPPGASLTATAQCEAWSVAVDEGGGREDTHPLSGVFPTTTSGPPSGPPFLLPCCPVHAAGPRLRPELSLLLRHCRIAPARRRPSSTPCAAMPLSVACRLLVDLRAAHAVTRARLSNREYQGQSAWGRLVAAGARRTQAGSCCCCCWRNCCCWCCCMLRCWSCCWRCASCCCCMSCACACADPGLARAPPSAAPPPPNCCCCCCACIAW